MVHLDTTGATFVLAAGTLFWPISVTTDRIPKAIKQFLRLRLGLKPVFDYVELRTRLIGVRDMPIRTVFDVGGNVGKMARLYRRTFPEAMIYSIEPVPAKNA